MISLKMFSFSFCIFTLMNLNVALHLSYLGLVRILGHVNELISDWIHAYVWLSPLAVHLKLSVINAKK